MLILLFVLNVANGSRAVAISDIPAILMGSEGRNSPQHHLEHTPAEDRDGNDTRRSSGCVRFSASDVL